jgi:hypothetical protein
LEQIGSSALKSRYGKPVSPTVPAWILTNQLHVGEIYCNRQILVKWNEPLTVPGGFAHPQESLATGKYRITIPMVEMESTKAKPKYALILGFCKNYGSAE